MRVLLVSVNKEKINMAAFPLGLSCVARAARAAGHEVHAIDFMAEPEPEAALGAAIAGFAPGAIGISIRNIDDQSMIRREFYLEYAKEIVALCREKSDARIILGGAGYSIFPDTALEYCGADAGIRGEGETAFLILLEKLEKDEDLSGVPGIFLPGRGAGAGRIYSDMAALPPPDYSIWASMPEKEKLVLPVQTRRGCPMDCAYCSTAAIEGRRIRMAPSEKVIETLRRGVDAGFSKFFFADNTFNMPEGYAKDLCGEIIRAGLKISWNAIIYPRKISAELVDLMARAGCTDVSIGSESGVDEILKNLNKRFSSSDVRAASEKFAAAGIRRFGFLLLGGPGETMDTVMRSVEFADSLKFNMLRFTPGIRIYPDTQLARRAMEKGMVTSEKELLFPMYYLEPGLEGRLHEKVIEWTSSRKNWIV